MTSKGMTESRSTPLAASLESSDVASTYIRINKRGKRSGGGRRVRYGSCCFGDIVR
jgi:hypothetical protein